MHKTSDETGQTGKEFFQLLTGLTFDGAIEMAPVPLRLKVTKFDGVAAELVLWLLDRLPGEPTYGEVCDVLASAQWWLTYWAAQVDAETETAEEVQHG